MAGTLHKTKKTERSSSDSQPGPEVQSDDAKAVQATGQRFGPDAAISLAVLLMMKTPGYSTLFIAELEWVLLPPILAGQYKVYTKDKKPIGFAAWAKVSPEVDARLKVGKGQLKPHEWTSGQIVWLIHLLAPFGGQEIFLGDLRKTQLSDLSFQIHPTAMAAGVRSASSFSEKVAGDRS